MTEVGSIFIPCRFSEATINKLTLAALYQVAKIPDLELSALKVEKVA
jgi:hypothetical protein